MENTGNDFSYQEMKAMFEEKARDMSPAEFKKVHGVSASELRAALEIQYHFGATENDITGAQLDAQLDLRPTDNAPKESLRPEHRPRLFDQPDGEDAWAWRAKQNIEEDNRQKGAASGYADGGLAELGGLATDGLEVDPVSGNKIPTGSNAKDVRDDVDAKLSEGEYVVPADVVKFYGVSYFEKLREKAKVGLEAMEDNGRIGGKDGDALSIEEPIEDIGVDMPDGLNMKAGGLVGPTSKANLEMVDPKVTSPAEVPQSFATGGMVGALVNQVKGKEEDKDMEYGVGRYDPTNYIGAWKPTDYGYGFSTGPEYMPNYSPAKPPVSACPDGYTLDEKIGVCVPVNAPQSSTTTTEPELRIGSDRTGTTGNKAKESGGGNWTKGFDYSNSDKLLDQTLTTLGTNKKNSSQGNSLGIASGIVNKIGGKLASKALGTVTGGLGGGIGGALLEGGKLAYHGNIASKAMANAMHLDAKGLKTEAQSIRDAAKAYADEHNLGEWLDDDDWNGTQRYANAVKNGWMGSKQTEERTGASLRSNTVHERRGEGNNSSLDGGYNKGGYDNSGKSYESNVRSGLADRGYGSNYDSNGKSTTSRGGSTGSVDSKDADHGFDDGSFAQNNAVRSSEKDEGDRNDNQRYAKGGLVSKPSKKTKAKAKARRSAKKGLVRRSKV